MINNIHFKFGRGPNSKPESLQAATLTVFVGPNNSGKSRVLHEIHDRCISGQSHPSHVVLDSIDFTAYSPEEARSVASQLTLPPVVGDGLAPGHIWVGNGRNRNQIPPELFTECLLNPSQYPNLFGSCFLLFNTMMLGGGHRLDLVSNQPAGDLQKQSNTTIGTLFTDDAKHDQVRRMVHDATGYYLVIDPTQLGILRYRLSQRPPTDRLEEQGIHAAARQFHSEAQLLSDMSDGMKAFIGILCEVVAGAPLIISIDEPEAFLHPSLAQTLGKNIAIASKGAGKRVFASTHSPYFLMGCIQSGVPINIVRLTFRAGVATARTIQNQDLLPLMRNPLLRSTGALSALFYEFVVVTESDSDRAFYQEVNERLLSVGLGIPNCLFLNAQNKQTVRMIVKPLRDLGIPTAAIVDIDVLKDGGDTWTDFLSSGFVPKAQNHSLGHLRGHLKEKLNASGKDMKRDGGITLLTGEDREAAKNLLRTLADYGLFVVENGELEYWLKHLGVGGHGPNWLVKIFEKMGEDPSQNSYVKPSAGDVWEFVQKVRTWLLNPNRSGIPD